MDRIEGGADERITLTEHTEHPVLEQAPEALCFATVEGVVQGVGFRPFVAHAAARHLLRGWVRNTGGRVEILAAGPSEALDAFFATVRQGPPHSDIKRFRRLPAPEPGMSASFQDGMPSLPPMPAHGFAILESEATFSGLSMPPADLPVCEGCLAEMDNPADRRHHHPFISCTACGPRYSMLEALPYDRHTTSMADFPMCPDCAAEYANPGDRRHHAQTVSCHHCGPMLSLHHADSAIAAVTDPPDEHTCIDQTGASAIATAWKTSDALLDETAEILRKGGIVAIKGIGGFHLLCDPFSDEAVDRLRTLKKRDAKPVAVMYPSIGAMRAHARVSESEATLLASDARPIVLLEKHELTGIRAGAAPRYAAEEMRPLSAGVCPGSRYVGAFLPYTPLHHLLLRRTGPLVATSANLSGHPIVSDESVMCGWLGNGLDAMLSHNRRIVTPQDDSVAWIVAGQSQLIRRARGYAPLTLPLEPAPNSTQSTSTDLPLEPAPAVASPPPTILALGGQQKAGWCMVQDGFAHLGEYLGDLADEAAWSAWNRSLDRTFTLLGCRPDRIALDLHPRYRTWEAPHLNLFPQAERIPVQHHHAHIASVMAEHGLEDPVLGLSFDGTGYGPDGTVWGGECLLCHGAAYRRVAALTPIRMLGGDHSVEEGWKSLLCHLHAAGLPIPASVSVPERDRLVIAALTHGVNTIISSSMGRLFDAVSALLGFCTASRYEGECAILLETATATEAAAIAAGVETPCADFLPSFAVESGPDGMLLLNPAPVLSGLVDALAAGIRPERLALAFHQTLCASVAALADRLARACGTQTIALSGGVFQNRLLTESLVDALNARGLHVRLQHQVPPNDGGLALGQAYVACRKG